jgi:hypothetical protein
MGAIRRNDKPVSAPALTDAPGLATVAAFVSGGDDGRQAWQELYRLVMTRTDDVVSALGKHVPDAELMPLLAALLIPIARYAFRSEQHRVEYFRLAQAMNIHIVPAHFSISPIPRTEALPEATWSRQFGACRLLPLDAEAQMRQLEGWADYVLEMADTPANSASAAGYYWENPAFGPLDAVTYHALIRAMRPRRILEVGGGFSTMVAARASVLNGDTHLACIDPFPSEALLHGLPGLAKLIVELVQTAPLSLFEELGPGDILFIDSTHISKTGSDVNHLLFEVMPRLRSGVLVHFHDIHLPWDYPKTLLLERGVYWNEQYVLLALLLGNPAIEIIRANRYLAHHCWESIGQRFTFLPPIVPNHIREVSFWIRWSLPGT